MTTQQRNELIKRLAKNKKNICEGDIIRWTRNNDIAEVYLHEKEGLCLKWHLTGISSICATNNYNLSVFDTENEFEIIGNIYQNKELIK